MTYSSSQGYHALAALAEGAETLGLNRKTALTAAAHALADGILAWREGPLHWSICCMRPPPRRHRRSHNGEAWTKPDTSAPYNEGCGRGWTGLGVCEN